jgi:integrase
VAINPVTFSDMLYGPARARTVVPLDLATVFDLRMHAVNDARCSWLFTFDGEHPARPDRIGMAIRRLCVRNELEVISPHDFRHFAVTQWLGDGVPVRTVAALGDTQNGPLDVRSLDPRSRRSRCG